jgi:hypothetical protein
MAEYQLFKSYEQDFTKALSSANKTVQNISKVPNKQDAISDAREKLASAERNLKLMDREITNIPPNMST